MASKEVDCEFLKEHMLRGRVVMRRGKNLYVEIAHSVSVPMSLLIQSLGLSFGSSFKGFKKIALVSCLCCMPTTTAQRKLHAK